MKTLLMMLNLIILTSCGQTGSVSSKGDSSTAGRKVQGYLDLSSGLVGTSDLLTVTMDIPVEIGGGLIKFTKAQSAQDTGTAISCAMNFAAGEVYQYNVSGSKLSITNSQGMSYTMTRMGDGGNDIVGTWTWYGTENGMTIHRRFTIPNTNRLIMNMDCESQ